MPLRLIAHFLFLCCLLAGCSRQAMVDTIATQEEQAQARALMDKLRARDFPALEAALDPALASPDLRPTLEKMAGMVPARAPLSAQVVAARKTVGPTGAALALTIEYEYTDRWLLAHIVLADKEGKRSVTGFNVDQRARSLEQEHAFTLSGKGWPHYLVLAAALLATGLTVWALVLCARRRGLRRKWLWILFILLGFGHLGVNWTTGELFAQLLHLQLFSAGAMAPLGSPLMVSAALPLGAILYLLREEKLRSHAG